ncbi:hypothetical protein SI65_09245 [Aspergillus cristatus]|uniref:Uncharacterized protein n=1 Tax=Aspergillus cristatus TaxID=573508 RepID=A0A1E3B303_ASPCR|nr:hypothetical protein SI65_09245 [Aspergillus cristatus]
MPVKWTPENDQLLLLKILETHDLSVNTKKVAEAWPATDAKDKPTPRAITERLVRMRQTARASSGNAGGFAIKSAPATPKKPRNNTTSTPASGKTKAPDSNKRAHSQKADVDNGTEDEDMADAETPTKPSKSVKMEPEAKAIKLELAELDGVYVPVPAKRVRKSSALPLGMVEYDGDKWEEDETVYESSASEFVPEDGVKRQDDS